MVFMAPRTIVIAGARESDGFLGRVVATVFSFHLNVDHAGTRGIGRAA